MNKILLITLMFLSQILHAQKEGNIWYFGENAGIDFNSGTPVALTNGELVTNEGCASRCDTNGNLLFYTDGISIWDKNHQLMPNGTGLLGSPTSTQSSIIVKKPGANPIYYVFTVDEESASQNLSYSEVDMTLNAGLGDVNSNKNIHLFTPICEKIAAIHHQNNKDFWIVTKLFNSNLFYCYLLTEAGLNTTPFASQVGTIIKQGVNSIGYLKASPNGKRLASVSFDLFEVEVFDFNRQLGVLSNKISLTNFIGGGVYGAEFSANGNLLYISESSYTLSNIYQFNLLAGPEPAINSSRLIIGSDSSYVGALQLALNNKIYAAKFGASYLGVIENPDVIGNACNYVVRGFYLGGRLSTAGLPTFTNQITKSDTTVSDTTLSVDVSLKIPNVFSPNNDGVNDLFHPVEINGIVEMRTQIFNRWGSIVFETNNTLIQWDGGDLAEGTYFWVITYADANDNRAALHGTVTLFR